MILDNVETITLFCDDLKASKDFYRAVFASTDVYADDVCTVLKIGSMMVNLLCSDRAVELLTPVPPGNGGALPRALLTVRVDDVDLACAKLQALGIELINGPLDRPWGRRTAAFLDPSGHAWEIASEIELPAARHNP
jgi:lactoylglutathione lyase